MYWEKAEPDEEKVLLDIEIGDHSILDSERGVISDSIVNGLTDQFL